MEGIPELSTELREMPEKILSALGLAMHQVCYDFLVTVKMAPHECVIRTGLP